ncbi:GNAT family N-acetyltransferase [Nocardia sp. alder85J]|uniref:GNAT family N-acetyltransferase n=1 Tax=Nocardia sp. alder85J TaxID=2862949 RepID=UPI001CD466C3|nr:GNAT family N-acetyltransferase [Nocardia sp. alder85J]MCX4094019.1 GNAT family N-acetyltransferase [Nocardia sp. alder85J]
MTETWRLVALAEAGPDLIRSLAECHITCWREAYRNLVPQHVLDAFDLDRRTEQWQRTRLRPTGTTVVAVAGPATALGFASVFPARDNPPAAPAELGAMYVRAAQHGTGVAHDLMRAVLDPGTDTSLWVFEENPRAQTFYRKYDFELDGTRKVEEFTLAPQVRMVRRSVAAVDAVQAARGADALEEAHEP